MENLGRPRELFKKGLDFFIHSLSLGRDPSVETEIFKRMALEYFGSVSEKLSDTVSLCSTPFPVWLIVVTFVFDRKLYNWAVICVWASASGVFETKQLFSGLRQLIPYPL